jgi:hypothetical protein
MDSSIDGGFRVGCGTDAGRTPPYFLRNSLGSNTHMLNSPIKAAPATINSICGLAPCLWFMALILATPCFEDFSNLLTFCYIPPIGSPVLDMVRSRCEWTQRFRGFHLAYFFSSIFGTITQRLNNPAKATAAKMASIVWCSLDLIYECILGRRCYEEISKK